MNEKERKIRLDPTRGAPGLAANDGGTRFFSREPRAAALDARKTLVEGAAGWFYTAGPRARGAYVVREVVGFFFFWDGTHPPGGPGGAGFGRVGRNAASRPTGGVPGATRRTTPEGGPGHHYRRRCGGGVPVLSFWPRFDDPNRARWEDPEGPSQRGEKAAFGPRPRRGGGRGPRGLGEAAQGCRQPARCLWWNEKKKARDPRATNAPPEGGDSFPAARGGGVRGGGGRGPGAAGDPLRRAQEGPTKTVGGQTSWVVVGVTSLERQARLWPSVPKCGRTCGLARGGAMNSREGGGGPSALAVRMRCATKGPGYGRAPPCRATPRRVSRTPPGLEAPFGRNPRPASLGVVAGWRICARRRRLSGGPVGGGGLRGLRGWPLSEFGPQRWCSFGARPRGACKHGPTPSVGWLGGWKTDQPGPPRRKATAGSLAASGTEEPPRGEPFEARAKAVLARSTPSSEAPGTELGKGDLCSSSVGGKKGGGESGRTLEEVEVEVREARPALMFRRAGGPAPGSRSTSKPRRRKKTIRGPRGGGGGWLRIGFPHGSP